MRFAWIAILCAPLAAQDAALEWFPAAKGNQWIYEHEDREGSPERPLIRRWQTTETVTGMLPIPEGSIVLRRVQVQGETPGGWLEAVYGGSHYLLRQGCLYFLDLHDSWDEQTRSLRPEYRTNLLAGNVEPEFCFPLAPGKTYGKDAPPGWSPARVVGMGMAHGFALMPPGDGWTPGAPPRDLAISDRSFDVLLHRFTPDETHFWFEKGVGITGEWDLHHGTYLEYRVRLLRYTFSGSTGR